ncbi:hypothetical protein C8Q78DRAFT_966328 [Trametes maxima]|nr:hypothetical protein C8Q78DRAFT_966328 [Trametes maxima]
MNRSHSYRPLRRPAAAEKELPPVWDSSEAWGACAKALREYDEDMIRDWKEEIDTLLVFAGLFSAILTAFNIESYKLLQQQPEDTLVSMLAQISGQLNSFSVNPSFVNTTQPTSAAGLVPSFTAGAFAIRLNAWWFSALVCSLLAASLGLQVKQWLREYLAGSSSISRESIRIRQFRHEGLRRWHVPEIILILPMLLQVALVLFFAGLLDLLWSLHPVVAGVVTAIVAVALLFVAMTSLAPPLYADCPYKSPQSWLLCMLIQYVKRTLTAMASRSYRHIRHPGNDDLLASKLDLSTMVQNKLAGTFRAWLQRVAQSRPFSSWKEREKALANRTAGTLDDATLASADATFMDDSFLHNVVRPCMNDIEPHAALRCLDRILLRRAPRVIYGLPYWELALDAGDKGTITLMHLLLDVLHRLNQEVEEDEADEPRRHLLVTMYRLVRAIPGQETSSTGDPSTRVLFRRTFEVLSGVINPGPARSAATTVVRERAFHLMLKLFPRFHAVGPTSIVAFCAYGRRMREDNSPYRFMQACCMVIRASATLARDIMGEPSTEPSQAPQKPLPYLPEDVTPNLVSRSSTMTLNTELDAGISAGEYASIRPSVALVVQDLEDFFSIPVSRAAECRPTMAMLAECAEAVVALAAQDRHVVSVGLVTALSGMVTDTWVAEGGDLGNALLEDESKEDERDEYHGHLARQAVRLLRRMYRLPWLHEDR